MLHIKSNYKYLRVVIVTIVSAVLCSSVSIAQKQLDPTKNTLSALEESVVSGNVAEVRRLIEAGADPNISLGYGMTPLHTASLRGHIEIVKMLLEADAKVNSKDFSDRTALILASQNGHIEIAKMLIESDAKLNSKDKSDRTALNLALQNGHMEIVRLLLDAGAKADDYARLNLGMVYFYGNGVSQDYKEAAKWFRKASEHGDAKAQLNLGIMYLQGKGVPQDYKEAEKWLRKAAKKGVSIAQANLGTMYLQGKGVPQDYREAEKWLRKAAKKGISTAQTNLGIMYLNGYGVPQDYKEAEKLLRRASEYGDAEAQYMLGTIYAEGLGVAKDYIQAYVWLTLAIAGSTDKQDQPLQKAASLRDSFVEKMTPGQMKEAERLAKEQELTRIYTSYDVFKSAEREISEPVAIRSPLPSYTEQARNARARGVVVMQCIIRKDGTANNCKIIQELGYGLDESAINTIENKWRFKPGTSKGKPVDFLVEIETYYSIY